MSLRKFRFYSSALAMSLIPPSLYRASYGALCRYLSRRYLADDRTQAEVLSRVNYYNRCQQSFALREAHPRTQQIADFRPQDSRVYYYDLQAYLRFFPRHWRFQTISGDVTHVPTCPALVKSRPIQGDNSNAVLLKLNRIRHYRFVKDRRRWEHKYDAAVWRGAGYKANRLQMLARHIDNPHCDIGMTKPLTDDGFNKPYMSIAEQLRYKFILCPEGNDVATNLKWVLSSRSLCLMPRPRFETWFMEGRLQPGVHYVELRDDYADLDEKMAYYLAHPEAANAIIRKANAHAAQFQDSGREILISLLVLEKYLQSCNTDEETLARALGYPALSEYQG